MEYMALKPCCFDKKYSIGETIPASEIDAGMIPNLVKRGKIAVFNTTIEPQNEPQEETVELIGDNDTIVIETAPESEIEPQEEPAIENDTIAEIEENNSSEIQEPEISTVIEPEIVPTEIENNQKSTGKATKKKK